MWKIGDLEIKSHVVLGPMAGITSQAYRLFLKPFGVGLSFTEMVSDCGLFYGNQNTFSYLPNKNSDRPVGIQLFGSKIENTQKAIEIIQKAGISYDFLDLNFGCPVPKVTKTGAGSAWLKKPQKLKEYVSQIVAFSSKPVTAKIRLGWNAKNINYLEVIENLEQAGVVAITIHARTSEQMYSGKADWQILRGLKQKMKIPLIISGDIFSLEDAIEAQSITGADAVMVARGAVGNPFLIRQIDEYFSSGKLLKNTSLADQKEYLLRYSDLLIEEKGEKQAMMILRGIAPRFFSGFAGMKPIKSELTTNLKTRADLEAILKQIK
ncbi:MAG: tRNA dihydrouridine synthase DusB [Bacilli bacterium]|jgi:tRNA-dihydrouridine synthase B|nr:tRNA dihydrouridine synthase DusB [Bacilli bacterium]MDD4005753.1 tRNA dihydrouridine synthase DusB [Bacilli bacterium]